MTRSEHDRIVADQNVRLERYDREMNRLLAEAQEWVDRLRVVVESMREGQGQNNGD